MICQSWQAQEEGPELRGSVANAQKYAADCHNASTPNPAAPVYFTLWVGPVRPRKTVCEGLLWIWLPTPETSGWTQAARPSGRRLPADPMAELPRDADR